MPWKRLTAWPLLLGAIAAFGFGVSLVEGTQRNAAGEVLLVIGAVLVGAWVALLARSGYSGRSSEELDGDRADE